MMCLSVDASGKRDKLRMGKRVKNEGDPRKITGKNERENGQHDFN